MFNFLKMAFSATNGTPSSTRILTGLVILNVMGVWTYSCVNTSSFIPLGLDNIGLILSCLGAKVLQKKVEENCNAQN